jgi:phytol kinase
MKVSIPDIFIVILVYMIVLMIIGIARYARNKYHLSPIISRHIIHLFCGDAMLLLPFFTAWFYPFLIPLGMGVLIGIGLASKKEGGIRTLMVDDSQYSKLHAFGPLYYIVSIGILVPFTWEKMVVGMAAVMIMAWGDGSASLIAPKIKSRHKYPWSDKSLEGSFLVLIFGFLGALLAWTVATITGASSLPITRILTVSFLGAMIGTIAEGASIGPFKPFDNFTVPLLSASVMYLAI